VTVNSTSFTDPSHLMADISVSSSAATSLRNVTVTIPGPASASCTNCLGITAAPNIWFLSPSSRGQGAAGQTIVITGSNFLAGSWPASAVLFSGGGITVNSVSRTNSTHLSVNITVDPLAAIGGRNVTIVNLDGGRDTDTNAFTVNARPTIMLLSPASLRRGRSYQAITITGSGFASGASVAFSGSGITVNSATVNSPTQLTVVVSLSSRASTGTRNVTVTNPDAGSYMLSDGFTVTN